MMLRNLMTGLAKSFNLINIITRQNAGLLRSVRGWGALGLVLAPTVIVSTGETTAIPEANTVKLQPNQNEQIQASTSPISALVIARAVGSVAQGTPAWTQSQCFCNDASPRDHGPW